MTQTANDLTRQRAVLYAQIGTLHNAVQIVLDELREAERATQKGKIEVAQELVSRNMSRLEKAVAAAKKECA
jgi:hypothetical protein